MGGIDNLLLGFQIAITPFNLVLAVVGVVLGTIIGVLPGLGGANGVAILLPLTFTMSPTGAIILLTCIYWGALFGGAITSILFNIPGEPWSVATTLDGYPLAKQGKGAQALTAAFTSSFIGALFAIVLVSFFALPLAELALKFGPPEFFAIQLLTFSSFIGLGGGSPVKSFASIVLGFILAAIGLDVVTGRLRLTFGSVELMRGMSFIVAVIGLFGLGEIFLTVEEGLRFRGVTPRVRLRDMLETWRELLGYWRTFLSSALIGFWMGFKPGGATPASFMSYGFARRFSRHPEKFGTGVLEGVVAPETAAHAAGVAAMLPMITLGIPGSPTAAVMLGGLLIWGLQPGPMLFVEKPEFVWGLIASMYTGNVIGVLVVLFFVPAFAAILRIPFAILVPLIVFVCAIGAYTVSNSMLDIWYMLGFGVLGYVFKKLDYPLAPLVLALVLGDMAETALRQSLIMSQGSVLIFVTRPIAAVITAAALVLFALPMLGPLTRRSGFARQRRPGPEEGAGAMPIVAMTREMGSLGSVIAQQVARHLGYRFLRNDLLRDAAREYRVRESRLVGVGGGGARAGRASAPPAIPVPRLSGGGRSGGGAGGAHGARGALVDALPPRRLPCGARARLCPAGRPRPPRDGAVRDRRRRGGAANRGVRRRGPSPDAADVRCRLDGPAPVRSRHQHGGRRRRDRGRAGARARVRGRVPADGGVAAAAGRPRPGGAPTGGSEGDGGDGRSGCRTSRRPRAGCGWRAWSRRRPSAREPSPSSGTRRA